MYFMQWIPAVINAETCYSSLILFHRACSNHRSDKHSNLLFKYFSVSSYFAQGSFKSSQRKKKRPSIKRKSISKKKEEEKTRPFIIKPIPSPLMKPLIVFINPKSGGNQVGFLYSWQCCQLWGKGDGSGLLIYQLERYVEKLGVSVFRRQVVY